MNIYNSKFPLLFKQGTSKEWAITLGNITWFSTSEDKVSIRWKLHEDIHKKQWKKYWYIGFAVMYLYELMKNGYWNNKFEIEAREQSKGG